MTSSSLQPALSMGTGTPNQRDDTKPVAQLAQVLEDCLRKEEDCTEMVHYSATEQQNPAKTMSITFSSQNLDYFEARETQPFQPFSHCAANNPQSGNISGFNRKKARGQPTRGQPRDEPRVHRNIDLERAKLEKWHAIKEMWEDYNTKQGSQVTKDRSTMSSSSMQTISRPEAPWSAFAAAHGAQDGIRGDHRHSLPRQTGRYTQVASGAFNRSGDPARRRLQHTVKIDGHRWSQARKSATFMPTTNTSGAEFSSHGQSVGSESYHYSVYDWTDNCIEGEMV